MSKRGDAYALALAIYSPGQIEDRATRLQHAVDVMLGGREDAAKADLYARIEERLTHETTFENAVQIIEAALIQTGVACG